MLPQLTYVVRDLFRNASDAADRPACLADYNADRFLIEAYQRGYKWKAEGLVQNLLESLHEAHETSQPDYYLQYLTVKRHAETDSLEVIDGQQRLTTLTLFFAVSKAGNWLSGPDFTAHKLDYAIRKQAGQSLLELFVYDELALRKLLGLTSDGTAVAGSSPPSWADFVAGNSAEVNRQDMFHLFEAAQGIYRFLKALATDVHRANFIAYVAGNTRLIVNEVTRTTSSEIVFHNINENRKELTDLDLVKGLLLTRPSRETGSSFRQIMEQRAALGRQWDEMANWLAQPDVTAVLGVLTPAEEKAIKEDKPPKTGHPGLHLLLTLLVSRNKEWKTYFRTHTAAGKRYPFFSFLRNQLNARQEKGRRATDMLAEVRLLFKLLQDWYTNPTMRNSLGVLQACDGFDAAKYQGLLLELTKKRHLKKKDPLKTVKAAIRELPCLQPLAHTPPEKLAEPLHWPARYGGPDGNKLIRDFLLLLNVFPAEMRMPGRAKPFDFRGYHKQNWSLEHIFPQNPDESFQELGEGDILQLLRLLAEADRPLAAALLAKSRNERTEEEGEKLKELLKAASSDLNSLGNLALLSMKENPALCNYSFDRKRKILAEKVAAGAFVPAHTFGVFAKLVPAKGGTPQLNLWGPDDIAAHTYYLLSQRVELQTYFST